MDEIKATENEIERDNEITREQRRNFLKKSRWRPQRRRCCCPARRSRLRRAFI